MRAIQISCLAIALFPTVPASAQPAEQSVDIMTAIGRATERFSGQVIAADLVSGRETEPGHVYALRMLTPAGDMIEVRLDAADGTIIEVNGRGLVEARKRPQGF